MNAGMVWLPFVAVNRCFALIFMIAFLSLPLFDRLDRNEVFLDAIGDENFEVDR
jgi:hypothetical protein